MINGDKLQYFDISHTVSLYCCLYSGEHLEKRFTGFHLRRIVKQALLLLPVLTNQPHLCYRHEFVKLCNLLRSMFKLFSE